MATQKYLPKAPISEALIDIKIEPLPESALSTLQEICTSIKDEYPTTKPQRIFSGTFQHQVGEKPTAVAEDLGIKGYQAWSKNNDRVVQFRLDGFSFSKLPQYTKWEDIEKEAKDLWSQYNNKVNPQLVSRLAVRYINKITIPQINFELSDYFVEPPKMPAEIDCTIEAIFSRTSMIIPEINAKGIITLATTSSSAQTAAFILDVDVFIKNNFLTDNNEIWPTLNKLKQWEDKIFFGFVTDKALEQYL